MLKWLANGPRRHAMSYTGYIINGKRFHISDVDKATQNSGVSLEATTICRSSTRDMSQQLSMVTYYGVLKAIILVDYYTFQVPLFKCDWASVSNGIKIEDGFTLVNLHQGISQHSKDPFILASQAKQIFYTRDNDCSNWYVVLRAPTRGENGVLTHDDIEEILPSPFHTSLNLNIDDGNDEEHYARKDCEGVLL